SGLIVMDVSEPTNPVPIGGFTEGISYVAEVCVVSNYLYVAGGLSGVHILSITNPAMPARVGWYQQLNPQESARATQVVGRYAYVANDLDGMMILDVANPAAPRR